MVPRVGYQDGRNFKKRKLVLFADLTLGRTSGIIKTRNERKTKMTKQTYTLYIYKKDARTKTGERRVSTTVVEAENDLAMERDICAKLRADPAYAAYRFEYFPKMKTVKNLMTGQDIEIDRDTPWCCNPASESYWSN